MQIFEKKTLLEINSLYESKNSWESKISHPIMELLLRPPNNGIIAQTTNIRINSLKIKETIPSREICSN